MMVFRDALGGARRWFRARLLDLFDAIVTRRSGPTCAMPSDRVDAILVIRIDDRVGDVLLTTPLVDNLRRAFPHARVEAWVAASKARLLDGIVPAIPFEKRDLFRRPVRFVCEMCALRRRHWDVAIDASHWHDFSLTSALLLSWSGARMRIAHERPHAAMFATHLAPLALAADAQETERKLELLRPLGVEPVTTRIRTTLGTDERSARRIDAWLRANGFADRPIVGLIPGGRKPENRLPLTWFVDVARSATAQGAIPLVLWGPRERALASQVAREGNAGLAPTTSLEELAAFLRRCRVVVANDTGPMHLSVACGTPTIAFFCSSDATRWGHRDPPHRVIACDRDRSRCEPRDAAIAAMSEVLGA